MVAEKHLITTPGSCPVKESLTFSFTLNRSCPQASKMQHWLPNGPLQESLGMGNRLTAKICAVIEDIQKADNSCYQHTVASICIESDGFQ